jgi:D-galactarolactone cycloisomerase
VREAIGPRVALMVDANHAYDAVAAIKLGRLIEPYDIGWFEEPVPPEDFAGYRAVKAALSIPIAGGECEFTRFGFRDLFVAHALDIAQPDTCAAGGLSECKIADMAEAFGIRYNPHVWGTGVAIAASLQLLAVLSPHTPLSLKPLEPILEFDRTEHPIRQAMLTQPIGYKAASFACPMGRGSASRSTAARWRGSPRAERGLPVLQEFHLASNGPCAACDQGWRFASTRAGRITRILGNENKCHNNPFASSSPLR